MEFEKMNKQKRNCYKDGRLGKISNKVFARKKFGIVMVYLMQGRLMVQKLHNSLDFLQLMVSVTRVKRQRLKK